MVTFRKSELERVQEEFLHDGYTVIDCERLDALDRIRALIVESAARFLGVPTPSAPQQFLNDIASGVAPDRLNQLRLQVIAEIERAEWFREAYFSLGAAALEHIVGNELAMQRSVGLSIQLPGDDSSLLPLHSDVWSEDSPFEVVLWVPLVDCFGTKAMFALPRHNEAGWRERLRDYESQGIEKFFQVVEPELKWIALPYGKAILFTHTIMHGNRVNRERTARWSLNVRFKGLFTPYSDKRLGEFFLPLRLRAASRIGLSYDLPGGFTE